MADKRELLVRINGDASGFKRVMGEATGSSSMGFGKMAGAVAVGQAAFAAFIKIAEKVKDVGQFAIQSASDFEQSRVSFDTMLGSAQKAQQMMADISKFAKSTPFELPEVVEGAKRLLAYNIEAEKIIPTMKALGNIAAGVGKDKMPQLILAFGQVRAAGKLTGAELRQFTEAGVPLLDALAKQAGKTAGQIKADMEGGATISFQTVEKALFGMSEEGGKFFNLMDKQSKTFDGTMSNLKDSFGEFARSIIGISNDGTIREGSIFARLRDSAAAFYSFLDSHKEEFIAIGIAVADGLNAAFISLKTTMDALGINLPNIISFLRTFFVASSQLAQYFAQILGPVIKEVAFFFQNFFLPAMQAVWQDFKNNLLPQLKEFWQNYGPAITFLLKGLAILFGGTLIAALTLFAGTLRLVLWLFTELFRWLNKTAQDIQNWGAMVYAIFSGFARWLGSAARAIEDFGYNAANTFYRVRDTVNNALSGVRDAIIRPFREAFDWIRGGVDGAVNKLKDLNPFQRHSPSLVDLVTAGTREVTKQYGQMFDAIESRGNSFGTSSDLATTMPATATSSAAPAPASSIFQPTINVNLGVYAGEPVEKRQIAVEIWREIVREARSQGVQLPNIGVTIQ